MIDDQRARTLRAIPIEVPELAAEARSTRAFVSRTRSGSVLCGVCEVPARLRGSGVYAVVVDAQPRDDAAMNIKSEKTGATNP